MIALLATYVHNLDPFAIQFTENWGIRWYGLAYVAGFLAAFLLLRWLSAQGACELRRDQVADYITVCAVFGVMVGGRLGYMLLYNTKAFFENPLIFFHLHGGGMSSHGGIAGLVLVTWIYARYTRTSWLGLGDNLVTVTPVGLFLGRLANFVNGELYGRPTESRFAVKFPDELHEYVPANGGWLPRFPVETLRELAVRGEEALPGIAERFDAAVSSAFAGGYGAHAAAVEVVTRAASENAEFRALLGEILTPRHPSQLYQAAVEGLLLFGIMMAVRLKWKNLYHGVISGVFFILYAIGRIATEAVREPDASRILGLTRGQFYSLFMVGVGAVFIAIALKAKRRNHLPGA